MAEDVRGSRTDDGRREPDDEESRHRKFDSGERGHYSRWGRGRDSRWGGGRKYRPDRGDKDGEFGWRGERREYGWLDAPDYTPDRFHLEGPVPRGPSGARRAPASGAPAYAPSSRDESRDRDYSGLSWGLSGGHRQDRDISRTGAGLEAGYASFHRPDAPDRTAVEHWRVPGPHSGKGPRNYQRSDDRIRDDVNDRLTAHGWIDATEIECSVENREVLLTGFVDSRAVKHAAEDVAESVNGVREVRNHLRVRTSVSDHEGVGRTSVLGLTETQTQTPATAPGERPSRTRS